MTGIPDAFAIAHSHAFRQSRGHAVDCPWSAEQRMRDTCPQFCIMHRAASLEKRTSRGKSARLSMSAPQRRTARRAVVSSGIRPGPTCAGELEGT